MALTTTVIVATYNHPEALKLALAALASQSDGDFEVLVADDGSSPQAAELLDGFVKQLPFEVRFIWQDDDGFGKARIVNEATLNARGELLIFLDGDCVPCLDLVQLYRQHGQRGQFMVGSVAFLDAAASATLDTDAVRSGKHERFVTLRDRWRFARLHGKNLFYQGWNGQGWSGKGGSTKRPRIRGANFAVCAELFHQVDGYDEVFCGYGKEDSDLRNRMRNAGARGLSLMRRAQVLHLDRSSAPVGVTRRKVPRELYEQGLDRVRARVGLSSHDGRSDGREHTLAHNARDDQAAKSGGAQHEGSSDTP